jgi:hypothetical protein
LPDVLSLRCRLDDVSVAVPQAASRAQRRTTLNSQQSKLLNRKNNPIHGWV